jgi:hypothetical protein
MPILYIQRFQKLFLWKKLKDLACQKLIEYEYKLPLLDGM